MKTRWMREGAGLALADGLALPSDRPSDSEMPARADAQQ